MGLGGYKWGGSCRGGKVNLMGFFQGVWESAGRGKSRAVSRMRISMDMCSVSHDAQRGDSYTFRRYLGRRLGEGNA